MGSSLALCFSEKSNNSIQILIRRAGVLDIRNSSSQNIRDVFSASIKQVCWRFRKALEMVLVEPDWGPVPRIFRMAGALDLQLSPVTRNVGASTKFDMLGS
jgi:hypothetical protein